MKPRVLLLSALALFAGSASLEASPPQGLVAHEWGTFTYVQGANGKQILWAPDIGTDLPGFVYARTRENGGIQGVRLTGDGTKGALSTYLRMETPVIYFYSEAEKSVNVRVQFPEGLITEWYPRASLMGPFEQTQPARDEACQSFIEWKGIKVLSRHTTEVSAEDLIREPGNKLANHYYAARETDANILRAGASRKNQREEHDKVLFYRGVGYKPGPLAVTIDNTDRIMRLSTQLQEPLTNLFVVTIQRGTMRYQKVARVSAAHSVRVEMDTVPFTRLAQAREQLISEVADALRAQGLFAREAMAMVETWRDQWFEEEGTRVLYLLPRAWTDRTLPLEVSPRPDDVVRVMVGRAEIVSPSRARVLRNQVLAFQGGTPDAKRHAVQAVRDLGFGRFLSPAMAITVGDPADGRIQESAWRLVEEVRKPPDASALAKANVD